MSSRHPRNYGPDEWWLLLAPASDVPTEWLLPAPATPAAPSTAAAAPTPAADPTPAALIEAPPTRLTTTVVNLGDAGVVPPGYRVAGTGNIIPESMHSSSQSTRKVYVEDGKELAIPRSRSRLPATAVAPAALATVAPIHPVAAAAAEPASSEPATSGPAAAAAAALAGGEALVGRSSRELSIGSLSQESDLWSVTQDGSHVD